MHSLFSVLVVSYPVSIFHSLFSVSIYNFPVSILHPQTVSMVPSKVCCNAVYMQNVVMRTQVNLRCCTHPYFERTDYSQDRVSSRVPLPAKVMCQDLILIAHDICWTGTCGDRMLEITNLDVH
jgi:hypothetical protein